MKQKMRMSFLNLLMMNPDKSKGWEGTIDAHLRFVRYPKKFKGKVRAVNK